MLTVFDNVIEWQSNQYYDTLTHFNVINNHFEGEWREKNHRFITFNFYIYFITL